MICEMTVWLHTKKITTDNSALTRSIPGFNIILLFLVSSRVFLLPAATRS